VKSSCNPDIRNCPVHVISRCRYSRYLHQYSTVAQYRITSSAVLCYSTRETLFDQRKHFYLLPYGVYTFHTHFSCPTSPPSQSFASTSNKSSDPFCIPLVIPFGKTRTKCGDLALHLFLVWTLVTWGILLYLFKVVCPRVVPNQQST
jgi:hypothetical protein